MSFDVDIERRVGEIRVSARFSGSGLVVLFGPSGAGKTSVLNMVAGLLTPERGHVRIGAETLFDAAAAVDLPPERRRLGYVFQDSRLFPHLRVRENLLYGHRLARPEDRWMAFDDAIRLLDIAHLLAGGPVMGAALSHTPLARNLPEAVGLVGLWWRLFPRFASARCSWTSRCRSSTVRAARRCFASSSASAIR